MRAGPQPSIVSVPLDAQDHAVVTKAALEPAARTEDADQDILQDVKCPVDGPALVQRSVSPVLRCCRGAMSSASATQPLQRAPEPLRGRRLQNNPKTQSPTRSDHFRPPPTRRGNLALRCVASTMLASARKRIQPRPPTPEDIRRVNRKLRSLAIA